MPALTPRQLRALRDADTEPGQNRVGRALELAEVTQAEVATATGFPQPYISDVARNRYETITVDNAWKFAQYFGCTIEDLFPAKEAMAS